MLCELCGRPAVCIMSTRLEYPTGQRAQLYKAVCDPCSEVYHERNWHRMALSQAECAVLAKLHEKGLCVTSGAVEIREALRDCAAPMTCWRIVRSIQARLGL